MLVNELPPFENVSLEKQREIQTNSKKITQPPIGYGTQGDRVTIFYGGTE